MSKLRIRRGNQQTGFTFVEVAVVAPIIILLIGAFITIIVNMTSEVIRSRGSSQLAYNVQDAINRIDQDVKLSVGFLAENNFDLESPQGINDGTEKFVNVGDDGNVLIINALATTGNPLDSTSGVAFLENRPNACGNQQGQNTPLTFNIVYFVKDNALWRRVVMPSDYDSTACNASGTDTAAPWQRPSCSVGYSNAFCKTEDEKLVEGVSSEDFVITYYNAANSSTANTTASNTAASVDDRNIALRSVGNVGISINASRVAAGQEISQSSSLRSTRLDTNASTVAEPVIVSTPSTPSVIGTLTPPTTATFSWPTSTGNGTITYSLDYCIGVTATCTSGGPWTSGLSNSTSTSYVVPNTNHGDIVNVRVRATNSEGTSSYGTSTITVSLWATPVFQSYWANYGGSYAPGRYTKTSEGIVVLSGLLKRNGSPAGGEVIFQLPVGYRPAKPLIFTTITNANVASRVDVDQNGNVIIRSGDGGYLSLDGIKFVPSASTNITFQSMTLSNSWVNYHATDWQTASYAKDSLNRTFTRGLIMNGSTSAASLITALPAGFQSPSYLHLPNYTNGGYGFFSPSQTNATYSAGAGLQYKGGSNGYYSIESMFYNSYTGWSSLSMVNGWTWYDSAGIFSTPAYTKAADGLVTLKGLIRSGTATSDTNVAILPAGFRPSARMIFEVINNSAVGRVDVLPSGEVRILTGGNTWLALDSISFMAEQ